MAVATLVLKTDEPIDFIVSNLVGVEKGTIMELTDPRTATANNGSGDVFAGIARREKIASDGRTRLALFRRGVFILETADGADVSAGEWVTTSGTNKIRLATSAELVVGKGIGIALEDMLQNTTGEVMVGGY
jgi:hypothetical protein